LTKPNSSRRGRLHAPRPDTGGSGTGIGLSQPGAGVVLAPTHPKKGNKMKVFKFKLSTRIGSTARDVAGRKGRRISGPPRYGGHHPCLDRRRAAQCPRPTSPSLKRNSRRQKQPRKYTSQTFAISLTALMSCRASAQSSGASVVRPRPCEPRSTRLTGWGAGGLGSLRPLGPVGSGRKKSRAPPSGGLTHRVSRSVSPTHNPRKNRDSGIPY
jgi:hypothetical protein